MVLWGTRGEQTVPQTARPQRRAAVPWGADGISQVSVWGEAARENGAAERAQRRQEEPGYKGGDRSDQKGFGQSEGAIGRWAPGNLAI